MYTPNDPGFIRFIFDKVCYYLIGEFALAPIVPFGGLHYLRARPLMFYGLTAAVVVLLVGVSVRFFRQKPGLLAPAWLIGFMGPVLPAFASPHHLYLPGVGWAINGDASAAWDRHQRGQRKSPAAGPHVDVHPAARGRIRGRNDILRRGDGYRTACRRPGGD